MGNGPQPATCSQQCEQDIAMPKRLLTHGDRFHNLTFLEEAPIHITIGGYVVRMGKFLCDCGKTSVKQIHSVIGGHVKSCRCLAARRAKEFHTTHGQSKTRTHRIWRAMRARCRNPKHESYQYYGGKGIRVCQGLDTYTGFISIMGECPDGLTIDRDNNKGHYSCGRCEECLKNGWPFNCSWQPHKVQNRHYSRNVVVTVGEITGCLTVVCEHFGLNREMVRARLRRGWPVDRAFGFQQPLTQVK